MFDGRSHVSARLVLRRRGIACCRDRDSDCCACRHSQARLTVILGVAAVVAGVMVAGARDGLSVSAAFIVYVLAGVFLGARSAMAAAVVSELTAAIRLQTRPRAVVLTNLPGARCPGRRGRRRHRCDRRRAVGDVPVLLRGRGRRRWSRSRSASRSSRSPGARCSGTWTSSGSASSSEHLPSIGLNVLLVVAGAGITERLGNAGIAFALSAVFTFSYMAHLLQRARASLRAVRVAVLGRARRTDALAGHPRRARGTTRRGGRPLLEGHG